MENSSKEQWWGKRYRFEKQWITITPDVTPDVPKRRRHWLRASTRLSMKIVVAYLVGMIIGVSTTVLAFMGFFSTGG